MDKSSKPSVQLLSRVLIIILPVATITLSVIWWLAGHMIQNEVRDQSTAYIQNDVHHIAERISNELHSIKLFAKTLGTHRLVISGIADLGDMESFVEPFFRQINMRDHASATVSVVDARGRTLASNAAIEENDYFDASWLTVTKEGRTALEIDTSRTLIAIPVLYHGEPHGAVVVQMISRELLHRLSLAGDSTVLFLRQKSNLIPLNNAPHDLIKRLSENEQTDSKWLVHSSDVHGYPTLELFEAEPVKAAFALNYKLRGYMLAAAMMAVAVLIGGLVFSSLSITRPLKSFSNQIRQIGTTGSFDKRVRTQGVAEFEELANAFNTVMDRLNTALISNESLELEIAFRRRIEETISDREAQARAIFDTVLDAIITFKPDGSIHTFSAGGIAMFRVTNAAMMIGRDFTVLMAQKYRLEYRDAVTMYYDGETYQEDLNSAARPLLESARMSSQVEPRQSPAEPEELNGQSADPNDPQSTLIGKHRQIEGIRSDGSRFPMELVITPMVFGTEKMFTAVIRDLSESVKINQMKADFISIVSHELRTPLTSMVGTLSLVGAGVTGELPDKVKPLISIAQNNADRLVRLVNDILDMSKMESGMMSYDIENFDMVALGEEIIRDTQHYGKKYNVNFALEYDSETVWVDADRTRIAQVVTNLMANAAKFSPENETVLLRVTEKDSKALVEVIDKGPGIPAEKQETMFEKFQQNDPSSRREKEGTGLGLSIAQSIVAAHGGELTVKSRMGHGSTFYFSISLAESQTDQDKASQEQADAAIAPAMVSNQKEIASRS